MHSVTVLRHPVAAEQLRLLRDKESDIITFRQAIERLGYFLAMEATREMPVQTLKVTTPLEVETPVEKISDSKVLLVPILRAGLGFLNSFLTFLPRAKVAHIGISRDHETLEAKMYMSALPPDLTQFQRVYVIDPMLATGNSCVKTMEILVDAGIDPAILRVVCAFAVPQGIEHIQQRFPQAMLTLGTIDPQLNNIGYITPGCGDAGDRLYLL